MRFRFEHYDDAPAWVQQLRETFDPGQDGWFCGCYEGDLSGLWTETVDRREDAAYAIAETDSDGADMGPITYVVPGDAQQRLVTFITGLLR